MKKLLSEKGLAFFLIFITLFIGGYFYRQGKISFLPEKKSSPEPQSVIAEIPFKEKEYKLSYHKPNSLVSEIANFEDSEGWTGDGEFDYTNYYEGKSSLSLSSQNHYRAKAILELNNEINFNEFLNYRLMVNLQSKPSSIEELNLIFADKKLEKGYKYSFQNLTEGWNILILPRDKFSPLTKEELGIKKVIFELVPRPGTSVSANFDFLYAEKTKDYLQDWNTNYPKMLSLGGTGPSLSLLVNGLAGDIANLKAITSAKNFSIKAKFIPLNPGSFGFFLRGDYKTGFGYYFNTGGVDTNTVKIEKLGVFDGKWQHIVLVEGSITNFKMEKGQSYWLKAETSGNRLNFYLSLDDKNYINIGGISDKSFGLGGVGIALGSASMVLIDDIQFSQ